MDDEDPELLAEKEYAKMNGSATVSDGGKHAATIPLSPHDAAKMRQRGQRTFSVNG